MMSELELLAALIHRRNAVDAEIAAIIGRPPHPGHIGEYVAAAIFGIDLHPGANTKGTDGFFRDGPLAGKSVNIKYGTRRDGMLNLAHSTDPADHADYYLVLTGPTVGPISSIGLAAPWVIHAVYLFESCALLDTLSNRGIRPGVATSVRKDLWEAAMVYPDANNSTLLPTDTQREMLFLFHSELPPG